MSDFIKIGTQIYITVSRSCSSMFVENSVQEWISTQCVDAGYNQQWENRNFLTRLEWTSISIREILNEKLNIRMSVSILHIIERGFLFWMNFLLFQFAPYASIQWYENSVQFNIFKPRSKCLKGHFEYISGVFVWFLHGYELSSLRLLRKISHLKSHKIIELIILFHLLVI